MATNSKKTSVPEAKEAMNRFKEEVASELGVPLKEGYNGDLTSKQAGSIGGEMVKQMIMKQEQQMKQSVHRILSSNFLYKKRLDTMGFGVQPLLINIPVPDGCDLQLHHL